jgi:hypothetical protein
MKNIEDFYSEEIKKLSNTKLQQSIKEKQQLLKKAIFDKEKSNKIFNEIEEKLTEKGISVDYTTLYAKIIKDDLFAMFFFKNVNVKNDEKKEIIKSFLKQNKVSINKNDEVLLLLGTSMSARAGNQVIEEYIELAKANPKNRYIIFSERNINKNWLENYKKLIILSNVININELIK